MELLAKIVSYPALEQLTVVKRGQPQIQFNVLVEASKSLPETAWEVCIWHNCPTKAGHDASLWEELPLTLSTSKPFEPLTHSTPISYHYIFTGTLNLALDSNDGYLAGFTIKFRSGPKVQWKWVKDQFGMSDGSLLIPHGSEEELVPSWMSSVFGDHHLHQWNVVPVQSQAPGASIFKVESKDFIPTTNVGDAKFESKTFGSSDGGFYRYMALVRVWSPWLAPRHGENRFRITEDALLCSFLTSHGQHAVLLPVNGVNDTVTVFKSDDEGHVIVAARNDGASEVKFEFLAAIADDFEIANAAVMYEARQIVRRNRSLDEQDSLSSAHLKTESPDSSTVLVSNVDDPDGPPTKPQPQWLEEWYDGLTYCTWNSLGQNLTAEKILTALEDLAVNNIHVSGLIIDDNWQSLDGIQGQTSQFHRGWTDFEANKEGFPDGLKSTVTKIKAKHPAISNIAVWHALFGYWGGISPSGTIAKNYKTTEVEKQVGIAEGKMLAVGPSDIHRMYDDFYTFLSSCGITSVKTDAQFFLDLLSSTSDRRAFTTAYQSAWTTAHLRHLSGKAISCMSQIPQILFHSFLPVNSPRILLRNSDDFFPEVPSSHPWHVFCNAHNSLFVQHLNTLPDWDMFQTSHPYSGFHAAARCVSGGPIYITDAPGKHDLDLIAQMTAENVRGQTVILRPSIVGKTINIYDQYHEGHILKVGTYNGAAGTGNGILGVFNVSDHEISAMVPITDLPGVDVAPDITTDTHPTESRPTNQYLIRSHITSAISQPITPTSLLTTPSTLISLVLPLRGYDILTVHPVYTFSLPPPSPPPPHQQSHPSTFTPTHSETLIAILGLLHKLTGICALSSPPTFDTSTLPTKLSLHVSLKALGTLGVWISDLRDRTIDDGFLVEISGRVVPRARVRRVLTEPGAVEGEGKGGVLEIDLLGAWRDMQLDSGWSNEVRVGVFVLGRAHQSQFS